MVAAVICGSCASVLWVSESAYIKQCSDATNINANQGLFYSINNFNMIVGNVFSIIFVQGGDTNTLFFCGLALLTVLSAILLFRISFSLSFNRITKS